MLHIAVNVTGTNIEVSVNEPLTSGTVGATASFTFDDAWDGLTKTAVFRAAELTRDVVNISDTVTVPWEVLTKKHYDLFVGVYGIDPDGTLVIPTLWVKVGNIQPGADPSGDESTDPSPAVWEQMLNVAKNAEEIAQSVRDDADNGRFVGADGTSVTHKWDGTVLSVTSASGTSSADLKGEKGDPGEVNIDDTTVGNDAWSSKNIVDKLCPTFEESGAVVACEPVEGYPLEVISEIPYTENMTEFQGLTLTRCGKNLVDDVAFFAERGFTLQEDGRWKGTSKKTFTLFTNTSGATGRFSISMDAERIEGQEDRKSITIVVYYTDGTNTYHYPGSQTGSLFTTTTKADGVVERIVWTYANAGTFYVKDMQIEYNDTATDYEPYRGETYVADFGGHNNNYIYGSYNWTTGVLVDGDNDGQEVQFAPREILALPGVNYLQSNTGDTTVKGRKDPIKVIENLTNAILALGGNV